MERGWQHSIRAFFLALAALLVCGWLIDQLAWTLAIGLLLYIGWFLLQAVRLHRWLYTSDRSYEPPESKGLWGELFDGLYRLQRQNQESQDRLQGYVDRVQESLNALQDAVVLTNHQGALEWWNSSAQKLLGFERPVDLGQPIYHLFRDPRFVDYFVRRDYREPLLVPSPANSNVDLEVHITLFGLGDRLLFVRDVTRLNQLENMRKDFVSNVSHELRTPLTVLTGYLETMYDHGDDLAPKWQRAIDKMHEQAKRMERLITDLLWLSKVETTNLRAVHEQVDIGGLLESVVADARAVSAEQKHQITLQVEDGAVLRGDSNQLHSAFSNLVLNAVKYTPPGGYIEVQWYCDEQGGHFVVSDNGAGFDPIHIPRLTERFYRTDAARNSSTGGTGLGLAIVKHVLINHGGTLTIDSTPGEGSLFACHFPPDRLRSQAAKPLAARKTG